MSKIEHFIGFYSEQDPETGYLSNWYPCRFTVDGMAFSSAEQYMMFRKAVAFHDEVQKAAILATDDPGKIKACGRKVQHFDPAVWNGIRQFVMLDALMAKFGQNEDLKRRLLATGDALLAECAPKDPVWGIGLHAQDPRCPDTKEWQGQNLLGFTLMTVREKLK
ncbi:MAG: NADAR family protein [Clostridia bacterium]|nr:NADAR family protein [Clostridia bacterium]